MILNRIFSFKRKTKAEYKIGKKKFHNSLIDSLVPEFVEIGENFVSGPGSIILAHDASLYMHTGEYRVEKTIIGDNVFIGANATIMPGVTVGDGAIIGAGAVVVSDIKPNMVAVGVPAKEIFTVQEYAEKSRSRGVLILAPASFKKIRSNMYLTSDDIQDFRERCKQHFL